MGVLMVALAMTNRHLIAHIQDDLYKTLIADDSCAMAGSNQHGSRFLVLSYQLCLLQILLTLHGNCGWKLENGNGKLGTAKGFIIFLSYANMLRGRLTANILNMLYMQMSASIKQDLVELQHV